MLGDYCDGIDRRGFLRVGGGRWVEARGADEAALARWDGDRGGAATTR